MEGIGGILREARERKNVSLDDIEDTTKIKKRYLLAMEMEEWSRMPGKAYAKGFLRTYARYLGLDEQSMSEMYEASVAAQAADSPDAHTDRKRKNKSKSEKLRKPDEVDLHNKPRKNMIYVLCILSVAVLTFSVWAYKRYYLDDFEAEIPMQPAIVQPQPEPEPEPDIVETIPEKAVYTAFAVKLEATEDCWLRLSDGDTLVYEGTMRTGEIREYEDKGRVDIRIGNAGGVTVTLNGVEIPSLGTSGQIVTKNYSIIEGSMVDDETGEAIS